MAQLWKVDIYIRLSLMFVDSFFNYRITNGSEFIIIIILLCPRISNCCYKFTLSSGTTNHDSLFPSNNLSKSPHTYTRACNNHCYSVYEERLFCGEQDSDVLMEDSYRCLCLNETFWSHYNRCNCIDEIENYEFDIYVFKHFHC